MPVAQTYQIKPADTPGSIVLRIELSTEDLLATHRQTTSSNLILVGQLLRIPT